MVKAKTREIEYVTETNVRVGMVRVNCACELYVGIMRANRERGLLLRIVQ